MSSPGETRLVPLEGDVTPSVNIKAFLSADFAELPVCITAMCNAIFPIGL